MFYVPSILPTASNLHYYTTVPQIRKALMSYIHSFRPTQGTSESSRSHVDHTSRSSLANYSITSFRRSNRITDSLSFNYLITQLIIIIDITSRDESLYPKLLILTHVSLLTRYTSEIKTSLFVAKSTSIRRQNTKKSTIKKKMSIGEFSTILAGGLADFLR